MRELTGAGRPGNAYEFELFAKLTLSGSGKENAYSDALRSHSHRPCRPEGLALMYSAELATLRQVQSCGTVPRSVIAGRFIGTSTTELASDGQFPQASRR